MPFKKGQSGNPKGGPKGRKWPKTLEREACERAFQQLIMESVRPMTEAHIANAQGVKYLIARDKRTGKFIPLTEEMARIKLTGAENEHEIIELWEDKPNVQAYSDLMNRAFGKPTEKTENLIQAEVTFKWES